MNYYGAKKLADSLRLPSDARNTNSSSITPSDRGCAEDAGTDPLHRASHHSRRIRLSHSGQDTSPEQLRGAGSDARSDLFSFGVVLYEMLSGHRAFRGKATADTISAVLREDPPELTASGRDVPPILGVDRASPPREGSAARFQSAATSLRFGGVIRDLVSAPATAVRTQKAHRTWLIPGLLGTAAVLLLVAGLLIGRLSAECFAYRIWIIANWRCSIASARQLRAVFTSTPLISSLLGIAPSPA